MNFEFSKNGNIGVVTFEGELSSQYLDEIRSVLLISLSSADSIVLSLDNTTGVDSSCMQMFCRMIRSSRKFQKNIITTGSRARELDFLSSDANCVCPMDCSICAVSCMA